MNYLNTINEWQKTQVTAEDVALKVKREADWKLYRERVQLMKLHCQEVGFDYGNSLHLDCTGKADDEVPNSVKAFCNIKFDSKGELGMTITGLCADCFQCTDDEPIHLGQWHYHVAVSGRGYTQMISCTADAQSLHNALVETIKGALQGGKP